MTNPYRAMCAELVNAELANAARKALGEPNHATELHYFLSEDSNEYEPLMLAIRAGIAADRARYGRPTPQPEPAPVAESPADGEVAELVARLKAIRNYYGVRHSADCRRAAALLEALPTPEALDD